MGQPAYASSKGGVVALTLPAARELAQFGVRVLTIAPGLVETPMLRALPPEIQQSLGDSVPFPRRLARPDEFSRLVLHIIDNTILNGETIPGWTGRSASRPGRSVEGSSRLQSSRLSRETSRAAPVRDSSRPSAVPLAGPPSLASGMCVSASPGTPVRVTATRCESSKSRAKVGQFSTRESPFQCFFVTI